MCSYVYDYIYSHWRKDLISRWWDFQITINEYWTPVGGRTSTLLDPYFYSAILFTLIPQTHTHIHRMPPVHLYMQLRWEQGWGTSIRQKKRRRAKGKRRDLNKVRYLCYSFKVYHGCYQALLLSQQTSHTYCMAVFFFLNVENFVRKSLKTCISHGWANNHDHLHLKLMVGCCTEELLEWFDILTYKHPPAIQSYLHHDFAKAFFSAKQGQFSGREYLLSC